MLPSGLCNSVIIYCLSIWVNSGWVTTLEVIEQVLSFSVVLWASQRLSSNAPNPPEVPVLVKAGHAAAPEAFRSAYAGNGSPMFSPLTIHDSFVVLVQPLGTGVWGRVEIHSWSL